MLKFVQDSTPSNENHRVNANSVDEEPERVITPLDSLRSGSATPVDSHSFSPLPTVHTIGWPHQQQQQQLHAIGSAWSPTPASTPDVLRQSKWNSPLIHSETAQDDVEQPQTEREIDDSSSRLDIDDGRSPATVNSEATNSGSQLYSTSPVLPMTNRRHAVLLQHFKSVLGGPW